MTPPDGSKQMITRNGNRSKLERKTSNVEKGKCVDGKLHYGLQKCRPRILVFGTIAASFFFFSFVTLVLSIASNTSHY